MAFLNIAIVNNTRFSNNELLELFLQKDYNRNGLESITFTEDSNRAVWYALKYNYALFEFKGLLFVDF